MSLLWAEKQALKWIQICMALWQWVQKSKPAHTLILLCHIMHENKDAQMLQEL